MCYNHPFSQRNKVFVEKKENENVDIEHEIENLVMETDEILHETIGKRKINDVTMKFKNVVSITLSEPQLNENSNCSNCQRLVDSIKEKLTDCSSERKIQILLLQKIGQSNKLEFFNVTEHAVKQDRKLKQKTDFRNPFQLL